MNDSEVNINRWLVALSSNTWNRWNIESAETVICIFASNLFCFQNNMYVIILSLSICTNDTNVTHWPIPSVQLAFCFELLFYLYLVLFIYCASICLKIINSWKTPYVTMYNCIAQVSVSRNYFPDRAFCLLSVSVWLFEPSICYRRQTETRREDNKVERCWWQSLVCKCITFDNEYILQSSGI